MRAVLPHLAGDPKSEHNSRVELSRNEACMRGCVAGACGMRQQKPGRRAGYAPAGQSGTSCRQQYLRFTH